MILIAATAIWKRMDRIQDALFKELERANQNINELHAKHVELQAFASKAYYGLREHKLKERLRRKYAKRRAEGPDHHHGDK